MLGLYLTLCTVVHHTEFGIVHPDVDLDSLLGVKNNTLICCSSFSLSDQCVCVCLCVYA